MKFAQTKLSSALSAFLIGAGAGGVGGYNVQPAPSVQVAQTSLQGTEADHEYEYVASQPPVIGYDTDRGNNGGVGGVVIPSAIEDSIVIDGVLTWTNPRIRFRFFTETGEMNLVNRFTADTGIALQVTKQTHFDTTGVNGPNKDPYGRAAYYVHNTELGIKDLPLEHLRSLTTGKGKDGRQLYFTAQGYQIGVEGAGKFTCVDIPNPREGEPLCRPGFVPARVQR